MHISDSNKDALLNEFDFVFARIESSESTAEQIFFLSSIHGIINRIINFEYDPMLLFMHEIIQ